MSREQQDLTRARVILAAAIDAYEQIVRKGVHESEPAGADLCRAARQILTACANSDEASRPLTQLRVRMTADGEGAPIADRYMTHMPRRGDVISTVDGSLQVGEVWWNFDPAIPADLVLFMVEPSDPDEIDLAPIEALFRRIEEDRDA